MIRITEILTDGAKPSQTPPARPQARGQESRKLRLAAAEGEGKPGQEGQETGRKKAGKGGQQAEDDKR